MNYLVHSVNASICFCLRMSLARLLTPPTPLPAYACYVLCRVVLQDILSEEEYRLFQTLVKRGAEVSKATPKSGRKVSHPMKLRLWFNRGALCLTAKVNWNGSWLSRLLYWAVVALARHRRWNLNGDCGDFLEPSPSFRPCVSGWSWAFGATGRGCEVFLLGKAARGRVGEKMILLRCGVL